MIKGCYLHMKVIVAMDSFKGSCSAFAAGEAIARGIRRVMPDAEIENLPVADGGEGTVDAIVANGRGELRYCDVTGPLGAPVQAAYGVLPSGVAVLEMSAASGLPLLDRDHLDPLHASTYGTGEMIRAALDAGHRQFLIGLGGSATNDGGAGMAQALGASLRDGTGRELPLGGGALRELKHIALGNLDARLKECDFTCAVDVTNTLCGAYGATAVYGPQKGVNAAMQPLLEQGLENYAAVVERDLGVELLSLQGGGAAGGLGAGLYAFCGARFQPGIEAVLDLVGFDEAMAGACLVITGEGHMDRQTINGKVPVGVAQRVKRFGKTPVVAFVGGASADAEAVYRYGIDGIYAIADGPITFAQSCERAEELLERTAASLIHTYMAICAQQG